MQLSKWFWVLDRQVAFRAHDSRVLSNSDINIINYLKLPLLLEASSNKAPSSRWPSQGNSLAATILNCTEYWGNVLPVSTDNCYWCLRNRLVNPCCWFLKQGKNLLIFSMESLWYSSTKWFHKYYLMSFQLRYCPWLLTLGVLM